MSQAPREKQSDKFNYAKAVKIPNIKSPET